MSSRPRRGCAASSRPFLFRGEGRHSPEATRHRVTMSNARGRETRANPSSPVLAPRRAVATNVVRSERELTFTPPVPSDTDATADAAYSRGARAAGQLARNTVPVDHHSSIGAPWSPPHSPTPVVATRRRAASERAPPLDGTTETRESPPPPPPRGSNGPARRATPTATERLALDKPRVTTATATAEPPARAPP